MSVKDQSFACGDAGENNIQVFVRIRPPSGDEPGYSRVVDVADGGTQLILHQEPNPRIFAFDFVADITSTQDAIFNRLGRKVIENCVAGYNGTIFAYGQTGSGKTFTMLGPNEDADNFQHELRGVIPRSFEYLYQLIEREKELHGEGKQFLCKCSFLEIYNEQIFDLLEPSPTVLHLRESLKTGVYVAGLSEKVVADASEAYEVLCSSWMNRKVASTSMNRESSRSHAVFCLQIESKEKKGSVEHIRTSQLNLVDLAGSERQKDTNATGIRLKEAGSINKSLSNLGNVIMALVTVSRDNKKRYIPYRDSKLTFLLRDSLGGNSKTSLIACIHPGHKCFGETLSTLQFAKRAKMIKNKAVLNENAMGNISQLQAEIRALKEELQKYKEGIICVQPQTVCASAPVESMPVLKEMFLQAMYLKQRADMEKQELEESVDKLKDIIDKKDKTIQTNKMIIKFRDNNVKRLEDKLKGIDVKCEKDSNVESLEREVEALRTLVDNNPQLAKYALETKQLKVAYARLKEEPGTLERVARDMDRTHRLHEMYNTLVMEQQGCKEEPQITPQRVDGVSAATVEKLRSQNNDLSAKLEQVQQQLEDSQQTSEKSLTQLRSKLEASEKQVRELELLLSAYNTKTKIEKDMMNDLHIQTVKTMLTPKKECYKLRSRTVVARLSNNSGSDLNDTIPFESPEGGGASCMEDEGIMGVDMPEEFALAEQEALLDQIKQLQSQMTSAESRIDEYEKDRVSYQHKVSLLQSQLGHTEQYLETEKQKTQSLRDELKKVEPLMKTLTDERDSAAGEKEDLKLMLLQADREIRELRDKLRAAEMEGTEKYDLLASKIAEFEIALQHAMKAEEKLKEENTLLLDKQEDDMATIEFHKQFNENLEKQQAEKTSLIEKLEKQIKEQELYNRIEENKSLQSEYEGTKNMLEASQITVTKLKAVIDEKDDKISHLELDMRQAEEKINQLFSRVKAAEDGLEETRQQLASSQEEVTFYRTSVDDQSASISELKAQLEASEEKKIEALKQSEVNIEIVTDELAHERTLSAQLKLQISFLETEKEELGDKLSRLEVQLLIKEEDSRRQAETASHAEDLISQVDMLNTMRLQKQGEIERLSARNEQLEEINRLTNIQCVKMEEENDCMKERITSQQCELDLLKDQMTSSKKELQERDKGIASLKAVLEQQKNSLTRLYMDCTELEREKKYYEEQCERLKEVAVKDELNKTELKERARLLEAQISTLTADLDKHSGGMDQLATVLREQFNVETPTMDLDSIAAILRDLKSDLDIMNSAFGSEAGHKNPKNRFHLMERYIQQKHNLNEEKIQLSLRVKFLENQLEKVDGACHRGPTTRTPLKENMAPKKHVDASKVAPK
ncbi:kinesin-like protein KIF15 isoform X2 [Dreissena polymorpha]|uniref:kinesin-like protein KIF15 isoform X2 n=1 Tax=Dreissena polymorpha TaxID=45954 RepID=UPI002264EB52|nr:kinesin-like protein KIF15 isoform X2 [Dreissena polymorpha]